MIKRLGAVALTLLILVMPAQAWNSKGHMTVAYIAYTNLDPSVRPKVDALLERHPDFDNLRHFAGAPNSQNYRLIIFMTAAIWPDLIRTDDRFYDETDSDATPTTRLDGYPSMKRFTRWHYIDLPFTPDHSEVTDPSPVNAFKLLRASRWAINNSKVRASYQAYFLSWLLHVAGDVHQPLHCTSRFTQELSPPINPDGDRGGNEFKIQPFPVFEATFSVDNLHSFWDNVLGTRRDVQTISTLAGQIMTDYPKPTNISTDEKGWIKESFGFRNSVYSIQPMTTVPETYVSNARKLARQRVAIAGYRLAAVLNERFKQ
jgi:hypothetical protein